MLFRSGKVSGRALLIVTTIHDTYDCLHTADFLVKEVRRWRFFVFGGYCGMFCTLYNGTGVDCWQMGASKDFGNCIIERDVRRDLISGMREARREAAL